MRLDIRTGRRWHEVATFAVEDLEGAKICGQMAVALNARVDLAVEARICDGNDTVVLRCMHWGWVVPTGMEGYTWVP